MLKHSRKLFIGAITMAAIAATTAMSNATAGAGTGPAVHGTEHFQLMTTSATSRTQGIIGSGVFTAGGTSTDTSNSTATVKFPAGTFVITHSKGTGTQNFNPKTCLLRLNLTGTYKLGRGTGAYAKITGNGNYQLSILAIDQKSAGKCSQTLPPVAYQQVIRASGPVTLP